MVDDIFSELDETRRENMVQILKRDNQVLFTMVDGRLIETERFGECARFSVSENGVTRES
jgi:recombinational DNA repair ATPase RecF